MLRNTRSNNEHAAKKLSDINNLIIREIAPIILTNGSAAYFNKMLYPFVNDFERKLRKLLYSASVIKPEEDKNNNISNLEEKDFGTIFDLLFWDLNFRDKTKSFVNANNKNSIKWTGYSSDLYKYLDNTKEDLLWDRLLFNKVPTLRNNFSEIRMRRNDVMHAHNIDKNDFRRTKQLFKKVNNELDDAIDSLSNDTLIPNIDIPPINCVFMV